MKELAKKNHLIISYLYQFRVLSYNEIKDFLANDISTSYLDKLLKTLVKEEYIEKTGYHNNNSFYKILQKGVKYLAKYGIFKVGSQTLDNLPTLLPAYKIRIKEHNTEHQISLNHFVLRREQSNTFDYYDEKYLSTLISGARPDGLMVDKRMYFLEMDMNTEGTRALNEKWEHYRNFLTSESFYNINKDILVLFILGGRIGIPSTRRAYLRKQILSAFPELLSPHFNIVIGTEDELFNIMDSNIAPEIRNIFEEKDYKIGRGEFKNGAFGGFTFDFYICRQSAEGRLITKNGEPEEFIIDDLTDGNLYSLSKISSIAFIESSFKFKYNRTIKCIEIVESEEEAYRICKELDVFNKNIYFTTISRLGSTSLNTALFQMDRDGQRWHFSEDSLRVKVEE
jgi:hypothetical protein